MFPPSGGDKGNAAVDKNGGGYRSAYLMCGNSLKGHYSPVWSFTSGSGGTILPAPVPDHTSYSVNADGQVMIIPGK